MFLTDPQVKSSAAEQLQPHHKANQARSTPNGGVLLASPTLPHQQQLQEKKKKALESRTDSH